MTGHGLVIGKSGEVLQIRERDKSVQEVRIGEISQVNIFGNVQFTAGAIQGLMPERKADRAFLLWRMVLRPDPGAGAQECFPAPQAIRAGGVAGLLPRRRAPDYRGEDPQSAHAVAAQSCRTVGSR